jgi:hypothetical protein
VKSSQGLKTRDGSRTHYKRERRVSPHAPRRMFRSQIWSSRTYTPWTGPIPAIHRLSPPSSSPLHLPLTLFLRSFSLSPFGAPGADDADSQIAPSAAPTQMIGSKVVGWRVVAKVWGKDGDMERDGGSGSANGSDEAGAGAGGSVAGKVLSADGSKRSCIPSGTHGARRLTKGTRSRTRHEPRCRIRSR